jgi:hypothetical protein
MREMRSAYKYLMRKMKDHKEIWSNDVDWIYLAHDRDHWIYLAYDRDQWRAVGNTVMNLRRYHKKREISRPAERVSAS